MQVFIRIASTREEVREFAVSLLLLVFSLSFLSVSSFYSGSEEESGEEEKKKKRTMMILAAARREGRGTD